MPEISKKYTPKHYGDKNPNPKLIKLVRKITDRIPAKIKGITTEDPEYWGFACIFEDELTKEESEAALDLMLEMKLRKKYTYPQMQSMAKATDETSKAKLDALLDKLGVLGMLEYDYGDGWEVEITLESVLEDKELPGRELPRVLAGEGYGIIEDCGGTGGLEQLAAAFRQKSGDDYENYREWLGRDESDLTAFDLDDMNLRLKKVPRIYMELYEYGCAPSQRSLDFLERKYLK